MLRLKAFFAKRFGICRGIPSSWSTCHQVCVTGETGPNSHADVARASAKLRSQGRPDAASKLGCPSLAPVTYEKEIRVVLDRNT